MHFQSLPCRSIIYKLTDPVDGFTDPIQYVNFIESSLHGDFILICTASFLPELTIRVLESERVVAIERLPELAWFLVKPAHFIGTQW